MAPAFGYALMSPRPSWDDVWTGPALVRRLIFLAQSLPLALQSSPQLRGIICDFKAKHQWSLFPMSGCPFGAIGASSNRPVGIERDRTGEIRDMHQQSR